MQFSGGVGIVLDRSRFEDCEQHFHRYLPLERSCHCAFQRSAQRHTSAILHATPPDTTSLTKPHSTNLPGSLASSVAIRTPNTDTRCRKRCFCDRRIVGVVVVCDVVLEVWLFVLARGHCRSRSPRFACGPELCGGHKIYTSITHVCAYICIAGEVGAQRPDQTATRRPRRCQAGATRSRRHWREP